MKKTIMLFLLISLILASCSSESESKSEESQYPIIVQKNVSENGGIVTRHHKTVKNKTDISFGYKIIKQDDHKDTVEMPSAEDDHKDTVKMPSAEADYNFYFDNPHAKSVLFHLWILPGNKAVIGHDGWYVGLSQEDSEKLLDIFNIKVK